MEPLMKKTICLILAVAMMNFPLTSKAAQPIISICSDHYGNIFVLNTATQQVLRFRPKVQTLTRQSFPATRFLA